MKSMLTISQKLTSVLKRSHLAFMTSLSMVFCHTAMAVEDAPSTALQSDYIPAKLLLLDESDLAKTKAKFQNGDASVKEALDRIITAADKALKEKYYSVTSNPEIPASKNPHDYFSVGPYWWPDKNKKNGLPWIRKDGETNPTFRGPSADNKMFQRLVTATHVLSLAYYFTEEEKYARKASRFISHWFLEPDTKMNPHLNFAQSIPGRVAGRGIGIIEIRNLNRILDASVLIQPYTDLAFEEQFAEWNTIFLGWLLESANGQDEAKARNNHGTFYDSIVIGLALHLGFKDIAAQVTSLTKQRISSQINKDGKQPHELKRTRPYNYTAFNLVGMTSNARMAEHLNIDLWQQPNNSDQRIMKALDFAIENLSNEKCWPGKQEKKIEYYKLVSPALFIYKAYQDDSEVSSRIDSFLKVLAKKSPQAEQQLALCAVLFDYPFTLAPSNDAKFRSCTY
ncbi:alginate lyase family protein [Glaciecola sp. MH2013]|uniref:alginate lyase family protein n=1 Tax=Glaciecola sp. MH2013 TaxID=2785524 RepID=UPI00189CA23F|nr:alginate lyase family protein [Glaciecola sp. MH2013]MBF7073663.1 alginate lyase family protein [Glaciecola sp. MH2013]